MANITIILNKKNNMTWESEIEKRVNDVEEDELFVEYKVNELKLVWDYRWQYDIIKGLISLLGNRDLCDYYMIQSWVKSSKCIRLISFVIIMSIIKEYCIGHI